jgi:hypothetical protein
MKQWPFKLTILASIVILGLLYMVMWIQDGTGYRSKQVINKPLYSRKSLEIAEGLVKKNKPTPPESSRIYAYIATVFSETLEQSSIYNALVNTKNITIELFPNDKKTIEEEYKKLLQENKEGVLNTTVFEKYKSRIDQDGHDLVWDGIIKTGDALWVKDKKDPFSPRAGEWKRWLVDQSLSVDNPPIHDSVQDKKEIEIVKEAVRTRTADDVAKINKWGGVPGTVAPAGLWQDQLFDNINKDFNYNALAREQQYAFIQKVLAQTLADAFMECWKVKYIYWTARPSMRIDGLNIAMDNPPFPGYVSGHSTISKAAADVLSIMIPGKKEYFQSMAIEARDSRLKAGIHFNIDNTQGYELGHLVAIESISKLNLKPIID